MSYNAPPPNEVYHLADSANMSIPQDIREQFQRDMNGRVLFFTSPPLDPLQPYKEGAVGGHSAHYLAAKARKEERLAEKRKSDESTAAAREEARKRAKQTVANELSQEAANLTVKALTALEDQLITATRNDYQRLFPADWKENLAAQLDQLEIVQAEFATRRTQAEEKARKFEESKFISLRTNGLFLDGGDTSSA